MKLSKYTLISFLLLIVIAALYRAIPGRPWGFAPQFAMAIFGGAILKDKKIAFLLPILSLLISDCLYEILYSCGITDIKGFYNGQVENYLLFASLTIVGFFVNPKNIPSILKGSLASPTVFFILSNLFVWIGNGGFQRGKTLTGLLQTYVDGVPFYTNSLLATMVFSSLLFGGHYLLSNWISNLEAQRVK
jgi:hypothetical protein